MYGMQREPEMPKELPSQEKLNQVLTYNPETGDLTWKPRDISLFSASATRSAKHVCALWNVRYAGKAALTAVERDGHMKGTIDGVYYKSHRVIWKMVHGEEPNTIDHINGNPADNRLVNLRSVFGSDNLKNKSAYSNNTTGFRGVHKVGDRWIARASKDGIEIHLGTFLTKQEAYAARQAAEVAFGFHPNHGRQAAPQG
jgi:hypothetical protein